MRTAHLLSGLDDRTDRLDRIRVILRQLGFIVQDYGASLCDQTRIDNTESQLGTANAPHTSFADAALPKLSGLPLGDVIVATAPWHWHVFKGLLDSNGGCLGTTPVVELNIDYPGSFARWRAFENYFILGYTMGQLGLETWSPNWIVADLSAEALKVYMEHLT